MLNYTPQDIVTALRGAKNLNSAVKNILKKEVGSDAKGARFVKDLKSAFESPIETQGLAFIERTLPTYELHLYRVFRYAYPEAVLKVSDQITSTYADEFNGTYTKAGNKIEVTNRTVFERIVREVGAMLPKLLTESNVPVSGFALKSLLFCIFDAEVLTEVLPLFGETL